MTTESPPQFDAAPRWRLFVAIGLVAAWFGFLTLLTVKTANPVTVNRQQLLSSDAIAVGEIDQGASRGAFVTLRITQVLAGRELPETVRVGAVEPGRFSQGGEFVVPLRETSEGYVVTPTPSAYNSVPLVYPATDEVRRVVEQILATGSPKPYR